MNDRQLTKIIIYILLRKMTDSKILTISRMLNSFDPRFSDRNCNVITTVRDKIDYIQYTYHFITTHFYAIIDESDNCNIETPKGILDLYLRMYHKSFDYIPQIMKTKFHNQHVIQGFLNTLIEFRRKYELYRYNTWGKYIVNRYSHFDLYLLNHIESFL